jgi:MFS family permease
MTGIMHRVSIEEPSSSFVHGGLSGGPGRRGTRLRRQLLPLYAAGFVTAFAAHAVAANLAGYGSSHRISLVELGVLLALYDGAEVLLKPVFGSVADRIGAKPVLIAGLVGFALASLAYVLADQPGLLGVARFAQGAAAAAFSPAAGTLVAVHGGKKSRGRAFGGYGGAKGLGYLLGPLGGGLLVSAGGYRSLFGVMAICALAVGAWSTLAVPHSPPVRRARQTLVGLLTRLSSPTFLQPVLVLGAATAAFSTGVGFFPAMGLRAGLGPLATGACVSLLAACAALVQPRAGRALDAARLHPRSSAQALGLCAVGFLIAAALPGALGLSLAAVAVGAGVGVATPLGFASLADAAPAGRLGQTMGAGEVGRELGDAGGPLLVGALSALGLPAALAGLAVALALAAALAERLRIGGRADKGRPPPIAA